MKKQYIYSTLILTAVLTAGCAKENGNLKLNDDNSSAIELSSVSTDPMTKAVITGTSFTTDEAAAGIGLFLLYTDSNAYGSNPTNVKYTFSSDKWTAASPLRVGNTKGSLYGYYPYNSSVADITAIPVSSSVNGTDWLYATPVEVTTSNAKSVSLSLSHALSRVSLSFRLDGSYVGDGNLSEISLSGDCVAASGTLNATDGSINATASKFTTGTQQSLSKSTATTLECLVVPVSASGTPEFTVSCIIDGKFYSKTFTGDIAALTQGNQTSVEFTLLNTSIEVDGSSIGAWGDGGSQTVTVGGDYKVTVKTADGIDPNDILSKVYINGNDVIIRVSSFQGKRLICDVGNKAKCEKAVTNDKYTFTFTISEICSDIEAVLGYAPYFTITVSSDANGKAWIGDDESMTCGRFQVEDKVVIHAAANDKFRLYKWNDNNRQTSRTITVGETDVEYSTSFISADLIPGLFTVSDGKQVFFSKGNLWYGKLNEEDEATFHFESNQYESTPLHNAWRDPNHISHFMWCNTPEKATGLQFLESWTEESTFFAAKDFSVNGYNCWRMLTIPRLTGGKGGEWEYLINRKDQTGKSLYKNGVTVCGHTNCLIFLPDDWKWGENEVGDNWQDGGYPEKSTGNKVTWETMEAAGAVCLPAAGSRPSGIVPPLELNCDSRFSSVTDVGSIGKYWTPTTIGSSAFHLSFGSSDVNPGTHSTKYNALAVRLVTDVTE